MSMIQFKQKLLHLTSNNSRKKFNLENLNRKSIYKIKAKNMQNNFNTLRRVFIINYL